MIGDIEVRLTKQEVQAIITALRNVPYGKCNFGGKEELIEKLKGKSNCMYRNKWDITEEHVNEPTNETANGVSLSTFFKLIDTTILAICEMIDTDTLDEQFDCIGALMRLRNKLKDKEKAK